MSYHLRPYDRSMAGLITGWPVDAAELDAWASLSGEAADASTLERWHADPDVHPYVLLSGSDVCGYGEVWEDAEQREAELARIIVDPARRGRGAGRALTRLLVERASALGYDDVWLRVLPENHAALACYVAAGMRRADGALERSFNLGQRREYRWMRYEGGP
jgi:ribosomal protein S18 acetylase RimI-like enzyme